MATATIATIPYRPPLATGTPTSDPSTIDYNYGTSTDQPGNTNIYLYYFIVPYLDAHVLSPPSWRYAYILWIFIPVVLVLWSFFYQLNRWLLRSNHLIRHPLRPLQRLLIPRLIPPTTTTSSSNPARRAPQIPRWYASTINRGQLISLLSFTVVLIALSLVGDDYISPTTCTWGGRCPVQVFNQGPPKSTYLPSRRSRRSPSSFSSPPPPEPAHPPQPLLRRNNSPHVLQPRASAQSLNPNGWAPFTDPLLSAPNTNVPRTLWTLSSRFGLIAYALIPFVVSIGLKSWPFNILAIPYLTHYGFDRTSIIHRWTGRLIWVWSTIHTITFTVQLARDLNPYGNMILTDVWKYYRFNWGVVAYVALTITVCFSFNPLRNRYYEFFYCSHVVLSILFLVGCIIHYEPLWAWAVIGLTLWGAERAFRFMGWLWFNGFFDFPTRFWSNQPLPQTLKDSSADAEKTLNHSLQSSSAALPDVRHLYPPPSSSTLGSTHPSSSLYLAHTPPDHDTPAAPPPKPFIGSVEIPPGFALVQVLPGHTLRLTLKMVKSARWDIGQYLLLCVPSVAWWQTHPYTICASSVLSDFDQASENSSGKELVLLLRARQGFSKSFYEHIMHIKAEKSQTTDLNQVAMGTLVRCQISRPLGSSGRIDWDSLDSLLIVCGGSGISFGISALEETCFKMSNRCKSDPGRISNTTVSRVCLVWIFREYAHLSWVAPSLKRCLEMVSCEGLQINLYVSNSLGRKKPSQALPPSSELAHVHKVDVDDSQTLLVPPHPPFLRSGSDSDFSGSPSARNSFTGSITVTESDHSHGLESQDVPIEFTDFEGESQQGTDVDIMVSTNVKLEGKRRRKNTLLRAKGIQGWKPKGMYGPDMKEMAPTEVEKPESDTIEFKNEGSTEIEGRYGGPNDETTSKDELMRELGLDLTNSERVALEELSESIKSGRPPLKKILEKEIENSIGRMLVACCGPDSLNSYIRTLVSQQDLGSQDTKKDIDIYTEDFSY